MMQCFYVRVVKTIQYKIRKRQREKEKRKLRRPDVFVKRKNGRKYGKENVFLERRKMQALVFAQEKSFFNPNNRGM